MVFLGDSVLMYALSSGDRPRRARKMLGGCFREVLGQSKIKKCLWSPSDRATNN